MEAAYKFHQMCIIQHGDTVIVDDGSESMRNSEDSAALEHIANHLLDL
eukprot:SAG31_NODE_68_length_28153_cov_23.647717_27_plen_48_part_00